MAKKAIDRFSIRYTTIKFYVMLTHRLFYRRFQAKHQNRIPRDRPVLLAPNHQNALMDAMATLMTSGRDSIFLSRGDIFNNRFIAGMFRVFKMLPVYRIRDGASELGKNQAIFDESMETLKRKKCPVAIMPEGNHGDKRRLRPLVKGIFRIAFQAQEDYGNNPGVVIVPVGIDYSEYTNFRGNMFIQYGEPIEVNEYWADFEENQPKAMNAIRERLAAEMQKYIIDIQSEENYDAYMLLRKTYNKRMRERMGILKKDLYHRLLADQEMIRCISRAEQENPEEIAKLTELSREYNKGISEVGMRDWVFSRERRSLAALCLANLGMLATLPVFLYGFLINIILYKLIGKAALKMKDPQFRSSVKFVAGTFLYPVYYFILFILAWIFTDPGWIKWVLLVSFPLSGLFAHTWYIWFKKLRSMWIYQFKNMGDNAGIEHLKELRAKIIEKAENLTSGQYS